MGGESSGTLCGNMAIRKADCLVPKRQAHMSPTLKCPLNLLYFLIGVVTVTHRWVGEVISGRILQITLLLKPKTWI